MNPRVIRNRKNNASQGISYGYVMIPFGQDRDEFVRYCYDKERVCLFLEDSGGMLKNVKVSKSALRDIVFPDISENKYALGSMVIYTTLPFYGSQVVLGVITNESEVEFLDEGMFLLEKIYNQNSVSIEGDAKKGLLSVNVEDGEDEGTINITVKGKTGGKVNIKCQTEVNIETDEKINLHTTGEINLNTYNSANGELLSKFNISGTDVILIPQNELKIGEATEPVAMADSLADILSELIDKIGAATVSTMLGAQPLLNAADIIAVKSRLDEMKSLVTKTS